MEPHADTEERPSRRTFVKYAAGSLVAHAALASLACSQSGNQEAMSPPAAATSPTPTDRSPKETDCCPMPSGGEETHLPPVIIGGSESVRVEVKTRLLTTDTGAPFVYRQAKDDTNDPPPPDQRYINLARVRVITEMAVAPYFSDREYSLLPIGAQLFVWYQPIQDGNSSVEDCTFTNVNYPDNDPDLRVSGVINAAPFNITLKHKQFEGGPVLTHKCTRPRRYKQKNIQGLGRHFRIGKWRLVNSAGASLGFEGSGAEDYTLFLFFSHP